MPNRKELKIDDVTMLSNPERERICRKVQRNKNKKVKNFLTPEKVKEVLFNIAEISVIATIVLLVA